MIRIGVVNIDVSHLLRLSGDARKYREAHGMEAVLEYIETNLDWDMMPILSLWKRHIF